MRGRTLVFLMNDALDRDGVADPFLLQELPWLTERFDRVLLVCHKGWADLSQREAWQEGRVRAQGSPLACVPALALALVDRRLWQEVGRLRRERGLRILSFVKLLLFTARGRKMHRWLERIVRNQPGEVTLYAYWMYYEAYAAALSKEKRPGLRMIARGHAFDIDPARNALNPYLMKTYIAKQADGLYLISHYAKEQFLSYMDGQALAEKLQVVGVGSLGGPTGKTPQPPMEAEGVLAVVSCATISPVKQVHVLIEALAGWQGMPLRWLHMGGGPGAEAAQAMAHEKLDKNPRVAFALAGPLSHRQVEERYENQGFDVFVNTSRMEGVPVSVMEAMAYGIPVIAPAVGGMGELVNTGKTGFLYPAEGGASAVGAALAQFAALPPQSIAEMRLAARQKWQQEYQNQRLLPRLFPEVAEACAHPSQEEGKAH